MAQNPPPIEAIDRSLALLEALAKAGANGISLRDLCTPLGMNKSTAYRALNTLKLRDFAVQDLESGKYALGPAAVSLYTQFFIENNLTSMLHPLLLKISQETEELVHLGIPLGTDVLYVDKVIPERAIQVWSRIGQSINMAKSSMGRAILSYRNTPESALSIYVEAGSKLWDEKSQGARVNPVTVEKLQLEIKKAKIRGYATEIEESQPGVVCIGIPILQADNAIASVSITAPVERMSTSRIEELHKKLVEIMPPLLPQGFSIPLA